MRGRHNVPSRQVSRPEPQTRSSAGFVRPSSQGVQGLKRRTCREPLRPCRVTNEEEETYDPREPHAHNSNWINLGPQHQIPNPELGPLERRVERTFVEAMFSDEISIEDTNYWFTEPDGGWSSGDVWGYKLPETRTTPISAAHLGPGRAELHELEEGAEMTGTVVEVMYYHGVQVDLGAQYDGLIPVRKEEWQKDKWRAKYGIITGVAQDFEVGQEVTVRIHKINHRPKCRWPIQLVVLDPDVQHKLSDPDEWKPPFDLRGVRSWEEAFQITGRPIPPQSPEQAFMSDADLYALQQQFQTKQSTAAAYGMDSSSFDRLQRASNILERIAKHSQPEEEQEAEAEATAAVVEDEDAYDESYSKP